MGRKKIVRVGMIGCGFYAQNHLHAWTELRPLGTELVAVCDLDPEKAKAAGDKFGATWYFGTVDEVILDATGKVKAYEVLWPANGDCNRITASRVRKPEEDTPDG